MSITAFAKWTGTALLLVTLGACGGSDDGGSSTGGPPAGTVIGAAGGTVLGPNGARLEIPPGALAADTVIKIEESSAGAPALPAGFSARGPMVAFTPHGTTFAVPVTVTLPFDATTVPVGMSPAFYKTNAQNQWERVHNATFSTESVSAQITSFSNGQNGVELRQCPQRFFQIHLTDRGGNKSFGFPSVSGEQTCGEVLVPFLFGATDPTFEQDNGATPGLAIGEVFSSPTGETFSAYAEAPLGDPAIPARSGGDAFLNQLQSFVKRAPDATLELVLSAGFLAAADFNGRPLTSECIKADDGQSDEDLYKDGCAPFWTSIEFKVVAYRGSGPGVDSERTFFSTHAEAVMNGFDGTFKFYASPRAGSDHTLWTPGNFTVQGLEGSTPLAKLNTPLVVSIDLSSIEVCPPNQAAIFCSDKAFTVFARVVASVSNRRGRESGAAAFLRDPQNIGGTALRMTNLEATNQPSPLPAAPVTPIACTSGPDPAAGVLQFNGAGFRVLEGSGTRSTRDILVTRSQGSRGAVSVTLSAGGGTAVSGVDYEMPSVSVRFADGDTAPRLVTINVLSNTSIDASRTLNLTLSDPGGCATVGPLASAVVTILDDDQPPTPPPPSGLDPTFGISGKASSTAFGGDNSAMALQADGKIVMVGGTSADFILARFNADGSLDAGFGVGGKVTTDMVSGQQEEALGVTIQPDGKIVVVGYTRAALAFTFALARYNTDGSLDATFGSGGKVVSGVVGRAFVVAIQPVDGKVVVAGDNPSVEDFALARYNANGSLDSSFGTGGQLTTDVAGAGDIATNIVLQPNGAIVVSGGSSVGLDQTGAARYLSNGSLDATFGVGGKLLLTGVRVGEGLARQSDGKLVLVGNVGVGVDTQFAVMRLNANGSPDNAFGSAGTVSTSITGQGDSALAVALQSDGKIITAGRSSSQLNSNFAVVRYNLDGALDTSFANAGKLTVDFFGSTDVAESVALQSDGKIVVGGLARNNVDGYGLARILP